MLSLSDPVGLLFSVLFDDTIFGFPVSMLF